MLSSAPRPAPFGEAMKPRKVMHFQSNPRTGFLVEIFFVPRKKYYGVGW